MIRGCVRRRARDSQLTALSGDVQIGDTLRRSSDAFATFFHVAGHRHFNGYLLHRRQAEFTACVCAPERFPGVAACGNRAGRASRVRLSHLARDFSGRISGE